MKSKISPAGKYYTVFFWSVSSIIFLIAAIRCWLVPFNHDETATFFYYIQIGDFLPYSSHLYTNNHILNSFLSWMCFKVFADAPLSLRLPNLFALLVYIVAAWRISRYLSNISSRLILIAGLLLSFHWLSFFGICRGYGISMALMVLSFAFIIDYFKDRELKNIFIAYIALDLAITANLILIVPVLTITLLIVVYQLWVQSFFKIKNILLLLVHLIVVIFWVRYSFFLQSRGLLDAGAGDSYWAVTFVSLINTLSGVEKRWVHGFVVISFVFLMLSFLIYIFKRKDAIKKVPIETWFFVILFNSLLLGFYLMKIFLGINFPQDRTALFFYLLFILNIVFIVDLINNRLAYFLSIGILGLSIVHFSYFINFCKHSFSMYDTVPQRFYDRLVQEQRQAKHLITVGGHRRSEFFYAFMNYRNEGALNLMDPPEFMHMNSDYYIAKKTDTKYYEPYYEKLDEERDWGFVLLKRKQALERLPLLHYGNTTVNMNYDKEYHNFFEVSDTVFDTADPIMVLIDVKVKSGHMPAMSWIVLGLDSAEGKGAYYKRLPLNWIRPNWINKEQSYKLALVTGKLPPKIHRMVCYLWNVKRQDMEMQVNSIEVFQLRGKGADVSAPEEK